MLEISRSSTTLKKALEEQRKFKEQQIKDELKLEKDRMQEIIDNVDWEIAERNRPNTEQDYDKKIATLKMQIEYERDGENRLALEKELLRVEQEKADWEWRQQKDEEKRTTRDQMAEAENIAQEQLDFLHVRRNPRPI